MSTVLNEYTYIHTYIIFNIYTVFPLTDGAGLKYTLAGSLVQAGGVYLRKYGSRLRIYNVR